MKSYVQISIRTRVDTTELERGRALVALLDSHGLTPEQVSFNPDKFKDDFLGDESLERWWAAIATVRSQGRSFEAPMPFAWRRKKVVRSSGYVRHRIYNHAGKLVPGSVSISAAWNTRIDWRMFFSELVRIFPPQIGMLHLFTSREIGRRGAWSSFEIGSFGASLAPELHNIAWATYLGDEFSEEGDRAAMKREGFIVDEYANGYLVQVTASLEDLDRSFDLFSAKRAELKTLYRQGIFNIKDEPEGSDAA
jgi:hypothetical protein